MYFLRRQIKMQTASSRFCTRVAISISQVDDSYAKVTLTQKRYLSPFNDSLLLGYVLG